MVKLTWNITLGIIASILYLTAGNAQVQEKATLQDYIAQVCPKDCVDTDELMQVVYEVSEQTKLDPVAILAVIRVESSFRVSAKNLGNVGLMQVLLKYHRPKFGGRDYYAPQNNVQVGGRILQACHIKHKQDYSKSFRCYNGYKHGDPKYVTKTTLAMKEIRTLSLPVRDPDPLGTFLTTLYSLS